MEPNYIGIDLHKATFQACGCAPMGRGCGKRGCALAAGIAAWLARCDGASQVPWKRRADVALRGCGAGHVGRVCVVTVGRRG